MKKNLLTCSIISILLLNSAYAQENITNQQIPEGFADLVNAENFGFIDIYFVGKYLGSFQATYNSNNIELTDKGVLFNAITQLVTFNNPDIIKAILDSKLDTNSNFICEINTKCKQFSPEDIAIIFDENSLSAKVIVNPKKVKEQDLVNNLFLPESTSKNSFLQNVGLNFLGGSESEKTEFSLSGDTLLSHKEHRIKTSWVQSEEGFFIGNVFYATEKNGLDYKAGYINDTTFGNSFTPSYRMLGFEIGTSLNTRNDLKNNFNQPLNIFLNQRSMIKIKKGNEFIYSAYHEAGNQLIDTSNFPSGSYNLNIDIVGDNGETESIIKFFVKSIAIPPKDMNLYYLNAGYLEDDLFSSTYDNDYFNKSANVLPEVSKDLFLKGGFATRIGEQTGFYTEIYHTKNDYLLNPSLYYLGNGYELKASLLNGSNDIKGASVDLNIPLDESLFSVYAKYLKKHNNQLVYGDGTSITASYSVNIGNYGSISIYGGLDKSSDSDDINKSYSVGYRKNIFQDSNSALSFNADFSKNNLENVISLGVSYNFGLSQNSNFRSNPNYTNSSKGSDFGLNNNLSLNGDANKETRWSSNINTTNGKNTKNVLINNNISNQKYGRASLDVNYDYLNETKNTFIGNMSTNLVSDFKSITFGGKSNLESGVLIDLSKYKDNDKFELLVNNISADIIESNRETFIPLNPYNEYNLRLSSKSSNNFLYVEDNSELVVSYPGNIQKVSWGIYKVKILSGLLQDEFGNILKSTIINVGNNKTFTDDQGFFQLEVKENETILISKVNDIPCTVDIKEFLVEDINYQDVVICKYEDDIKAEDIETKELFVEQKPINQSINSSVINVDNNLNKTTEETIITEKSNNIDVSTINKDHIKGNNIEVSTINKDYIQDNIIENKSIIKKYKENDFISPKSYSYSCKETEEYKINNGDTISKIIKNKYGKYTQRMVNLIKECNNIKDINKIYSSQTIHIPILKENNKDSNGIEINVIKNTIDNNIKEKSIGFDICDTEIQISRPLSIENFEIKDVYYKIKESCFNYYTNIKNKSHIVKKGETLYSIKKLYKLSKEKFDKIIIDNNINNINRIYENQELLL